MMERFCSNGHKYFKSTDCPTCPVCEKNKNKFAYLENLSAPARRALVSNNILTLEILATYSEKELLSFHGIGKTSIPKLKEHLLNSGLDFKHHK